MNSGPLMATIFESLGWIIVVLDIAGLVICIRYLRLSTAMPLLVLAFAGFSGAGFVSHLLYIAISLSILPESLQNMISLVSYGIHTAGMAVLVVGLWLVFRDVRERFQFLREVHETTRDRTSASVVDVSHRG